MKRIDFNSSSFHGFEDGEDILVDTGILFAYFNEYDAYFETISGLFLNHILNNQKSLFLYINPTIIDEVTHLAKTPLKQYLKSHESETSNFTNDDHTTLQDKITYQVRELVEKEVLLVLDGDRNSVLKQLDLYKQLGSADAANASIANLYGTSFLTIDARLSHNIDSVQSELPNIKNIYYTSGRYRTY